MREIDKNSVGMFVAFSRGFCGKEELVLARISKLYIHLDEVGAAEITFTDTGRTLRITNLDLLTPIHVGIDEWNAVNKQLVKGFQ